MASLTPRSGQLAGCLTAAVLLLAATPGCSTWRGAQLYQSGTHALRQGDVADSVRDLERAAELVPHASEVQNHLGLAYEADGRGGEALAAFERAVDLDCDNAAAQANLSRLGHRIRPEPKLTSGGHP